MEMQNEVMGYGAGLGFDTRKCQTPQCPNRFANFMDNDYKTLCVDCYRKLARKCNVCKVNNLRIGAPAWQVACTSCFVNKKREGGWLPCPTCPPEYMNHLRRRPNEPMCGACADDRIKQFARLATPPVDSVSMEINDAPVEVQVARVNETLFVGKKTQ